MSRSVKDLSSYSDWCMSRRGVRRVTGINRHFNTGDAFMVSVIVRQVAQASQSAKHCWYVQHGAAQDNPAC